MPLTELQKSQRKKWYDAHRLEVLQKRKANPQIPNYQSHLFWEAKHRAAARGLEFNIDRADVIIPEYCPLLGIKITRIRGAGYVDSNPSLDRIDSSRGYVKGNVQVLSNLANRMKSNASIDQLLVFAANVQRIYGEGEIDVKGD